MKLVALLGELVERLKSNKSNVGCSMIAFDKTKFTKEQAIAWAKENDYAADQLSETELSFHIRQRSFDKIDVPTSIRLDVAGKGITLFGGKLKTVKVNQNEPKVGERMFQTFDFRMKDQAAVRSKQFNLDADFEIEGIANAHIEDRMREIVDPGGVDLRNFQNNPVLLFQHNHNEAIGTVSKMWSEEDGLHFEAHVGSPKKAPLTDRQKQVRSLIAQGILRTVSIGFIPKEIQWPTYNEQGDVVQPMKILKSDLLELSVVAVPANQGAIFDMKGMSSHLQTFADFAKAATLIGKGIDELTEAEMDELKKLLIAIEDRLKALANDTKAIIDAQKSLQTTLDKKDGAGANMDDDEDEEEEEEGDGKAVAELTKKVETLSASVTESTKNIDKLTDLVKLLAEAPKK